MRSAAWSGTGYRPGHEFFSARGVAGPVFGQVHAGSDQALESRRSKRQSNTDDRILDFATIAVVLSFDSNGFLARFGRSGFVDHADGLWSDCSLATSLRHRRSTSSWFHLMDSRNRWSVRGATPCFNAIASTFFRCNSESNPRTYAAKSRRPLTP